MIFEIERKKFLELFKLQEYKIEFNPRRGMF